MDKNNPPLPSVKRSFASTSTTIVSPAGPVPAQSGLAALGLGTAQLDAMSQEGKQLLLKLFAGTPPQVGIQANPPCFSIASRECSFADVQNAAAHLADAGATHHARLLWAAAALAEGFGTLEQAAALTKCVLIVLDEPLHADQAQALFAQALALGQYTAVDGGQSAIWSEWMDCDARLLRGHPSVSRALRDVATNVLASACVQAMSPLGVDAAREAATAVLGKADALGDTQVAGDAVAALVGMVDLDPSGKTRALLTSPPATRYLAIQVFNACKKAPLSTLRVLLSLGIDANAPVTLGGATPLVVASNHGNLDAVKLLCSHGAGIHLAARSGLTPFDMACKYGHADVAGYLLSRDTDVARRTAAATRELPAACARTHAELVRVLVAHGAPVNLADPSGCTLLWHACSHGWIGVVRALVASGADLDRADGVGETPFFIACATGNLEVAKFLFVQGANITTPNRKRVTPLRAAAKHGQSETYQWLAKHY